MDSIGVRIVSVPVEVDFTCSDCFWENSIDYNDFTELMGVDYPGDWEGQTLKCKDCGKEFKIDDVEWD